jgi:hypothetical protein
MKECISAPPQNSSASKAKPNRRQF